MALACAATSISLWSMGVREEMGRERESEREEE